MLAIPGVPVYFLSQPDLVARWAGQLSRLQLLDPQSRMVGEHVLHEHEAWVGAFNFFIHLSSIFKLLLKTVVPAQAQARKDTLQKPRFLQCGAAGMVDDVANVEAAVERVPIAP